MYADNLLGLTQNFLAPDMVNRFSSAIGESTEKTQKGLKSIIPALLLGIVKKGQTKDGAESLVNLVNKDAVEGEGLPNYSDTDYLNKGTDAIQGIFGNDLGQVLNKLGDSTGINTAGVSKVLGMAAPMVMGSIGTKMKKEGMSASGLMGFLSQQKGAITNLVPEGLVGRISGAGAGISQGLKSATSGVKESAKFGGKNKNEISWVSLGVIALAIIAAFWWFTGRKNVGMITSPTEELVTSPVKSIAPGIGEIDTFVKSGGTAGSGTFRFENLNFDTGSAVLMAGAEGELDEIARVLRENPAVSIKVQGFTDNTGPEDANIDISARRAMAVKEQLVVRGVEAFRIQTMGMGSSNPTADNSTEEGRALNRRIEVEVLDVK